jgi:predicted TPR repeat methyltransferase
MPSRFDEAAATWDEQPARVAMTRGIAEAIFRQVPVRSSMTAVDYGCGTGLLTLALHSAVQRIVGVDSSSAMLAKLQEKAQTGGFDNVEARLLDLQDQRAPSDIAPDLIVSAMALHHIADLPRLLRAFAEWLRPGGYVALADLDAEDGSFHPDPTDVHHHGIDRDWLMTQMTELGLHDARATTAHAIERPDAAGSVRRYPVFLTTGHKAG